MSDQELASEIRQQIPPDGAWSQFSDEQLAGLARVCIAKCWFSFSRYPPCRECLNDLNAGENNVPA